MSITAASLAEKLWRYAASGEFTPDELWEIVRRRWPDVPLEEISRAIAINLELAEVDVLEAKFIELRDIADFGGRRA